MSRFDEVVNEAIGEVVLSESPFRAETLAQHIAELVRARQGAARAEVTIAARYPEHKPAPVSGVQTQEIYTLHGRAVAFEHGTRRIVGVSATGMTACPVRAGAGRRARARAPVARTGFSEEQIERILRSVPVATHNQRGLATLQIGCIEDCVAEIDASALLQIAEASMSSEIYELMKRSDEVEVVEKAHRRPRFVEDCVREMVAGVVSALPRAGRRELRLSAPGEPGDDPPAQRRRRAPRAAVARCGPRSSPARRPRARRASRTGSTRAPSVSCRPERGSAASPAHAEEVVQAGEHRHHHGQVEQRRRPTVARRGRRSRPGSWRSAGRS